MGWGDGKESHEHSLSNSVPTRLNLRMSYTSEFRASLSWGPRSPPLPATDSNQAVLGLWYHLVASLGTVWLLTSFLLHLFISSGVLVGWGHMCIIISHPILISLHFTFLLLFILSASQHSSFPVTGLSSTSSSLHSLQVIFYFIY